MKASEINQQDYFQYLTNNDLVSILKGLKDGITEAPERIEPSFDLNNTRADLSRENEIKQIVSSLGPEEKKVVYLHLAREIKNRKKNPARSKVIKKAKTSAIAGILSGILSLGLYVGVPGAIGYGIHQIGKEETHKLANISTRVTDWRRGGFNSVLLVDFVIQNTNNFAIKDIRVECVGFSASGKEIDSNTEDIYDIIPAKGNLILKDFNMGFLHPQVTRIKCLVTRATEVN